MNTRTLIVALALLGMSGCAAPVATIDYYDLKGVVESLAGALGLDPLFEAVETPTLRPGASAARQRQSMYPAGQH